ncbi:hypothetical protein ACLI08_04985 [Flavobacterium sp. RNTU_13]|uniref:hypothetical protein n=1 Tax=Flavobacterium sp. RNTU_13 TaxID=3375145 RepID=UPI0039864C15
METEEIKERIIKVFLQERQDIHASYNTDNLFSYLIEPPAKKGTLKNSFKGTKKYYRFMDGLELEFGICFRLAELEDEYSIDRLAKKINERLHKGSGNKKIIRERLKEKHRYILEVILILIITGVYFWLGIHLISIVITVLCLGMMYWLVNSRVYTKRHDRKLAEIILNK